MLNLENTFETAKRASTTRANKIPLRSVLQTIFDALKLMRAC